MTNPKNFTRLEEQLILLSWLNSQFGYESSSELLADLKETAEGFDSSGQSYVTLRIQSRGKELKIPPDDLLRYDRNVRRHIESMNARRNAPITLRYFQYLAALYTELFLDWKFHCPGKLISSLNDLVNKRNAARFGNDSIYSTFTEADIKKLAYWMATGAGKTLILHINYRQFLHYNDMPLDNILLITPDEGLSEQHIDEMMASDISCQRFDSDYGQLGLQEENVVRVIEITKLVERKRGGGQSIPVEALEGNNLIFVDEGHKGSRGEAWRKVRDSLAETGFTFEYSATFGQALTAARNRYLVEEYGKAIAFDYSYRYFHGDGYGKDFRVLNQSGENTNDSVDTLMLGNLLSFHEQQRAFVNGGDALQSYHIEKPLWVFVGGTVNAVYKRKGQPRSDVLNVVRFLHKILGNRNNWAIRGIEKILRGETGLKTPYGQDVFAGRFASLKKAGYSAETIYRDILETVFLSQSSGGLHLCFIRGSDGEIGLKTSGTDDYFGLVYIGDTSAFRKLVESDGTEMTIEEDAFTSSLFDNVNTPDTKINILIGAKKFMEGWNSWRVSNMGLLNIGRREGSEIIQLFGRGVRLRGKELSLKRSAALSGPHPEDLPLLETLNIFGVRAEYMANFRDYLEREGVETEETVQLPVPIRINKEFLGRGLVVPRLKEEHCFEEKEVMLKPVSAVRARIDTTPKVQMLESGGDSLKEDVASSGHERSIPAESLDLIDWGKAYLDILDHKERKSLRNLVVHHSSLRNVLEAKDDMGVPLCVLVADDETVEPKSFRGKEALQEAAVGLLRNYADNFYRVSREEYEMENLIYRELDEGDPNLNFKSGEDDGQMGYLVSISISREELIEKIEDLIEKADLLYERETSELERIHFDRHIYQPLLLDQLEEGVSVFPPGLNKGEREFVSDLKNYWTREKDRKLAGKEVFLLRNQGRGIGIGFFEELKFYPDFILWIKDKTKQRILFVDPHGMMYAPSYEHDHKARLHETLREMSREISKKHKGKSDVVLDSYIISVTPYETLRTNYDNGRWNKKKFEEHHIMFREENCDHIDGIFGIKRQFQK